jgi:hypothetical protein
LPKALSWKELETDASDVVQKDCDDLALAQHAIHNFGSKEVFHKPFHILSKLRNRAVAWTCSAFFEELHSAYDSTLPPRCFS